MTTVWIVFRGDVDSTDVISVHETSSGADKEAERRRRAYIRKYGKGYSGDYAPRFYSEAFEVKP